MGSTGNGKRVTAPKVLVFTVDDGLFGVHLDWVDAVCPRAETGLHWLRDDARRSRAFLVYAGTPALVVDLREIFGLDTVLPETTREHYLVMRSGPLRLALAVDGCAGVRELDLATRVPLPAAVLRDGGMPAGHVVAAEGDRMFVVLDPNRFIDGGAREGLLALQRKAVAFQERQEKLDTLWQQVRSGASVADLRAFGRLCSRNGRSRAAVATRLLIKCMGNGGGADTGGSSAAYERVVRELIRLSRSRGTGTLRVQADDGSAEGRIAVADGRVLDAFCGSEWGRSALASLLSLKKAHVQFAEEEQRETCARFAESTAALVIDAFEALGSEKRRRRA